MATSLVAIIALFALLDSVWRVSANDQERNTSLVEQTSALHRLTQELGETYQLNGPTTTGTSNYIDVNAWLTKSGASQQARRLVYNCAIASSVAGQRRCVRYEMPTTDTTPVASLPSDLNAKASTAISRVLNGTEASKVFTLSSPRETGGGRPSYGEVTILTPGAGKRYPYANNNSYTYSTTLNGAFYMRNLDFGQ
jgi:hypothetical protein